MKYLRLLPLFLICATITPTETFAQAPGTVVYSNIPTPLPGNVPSIGFQATSSSELGDMVRLEADTPRRAGYATVLMSSWSLHSNYPTLPAGGYQHLVSLSIYANAANARAGVPLASVTQLATIPWRPEADPTCPGGTAWRATNSQCYNGMAFTLIFDLRPLNVTLPDEFIFGVAYNTNTWGYNPIGAPGPYESLNVGTSAVTTVGFDVDPDVAYWNTKYGPFYTDSGLDGVGEFRADIGWTGFAPAVEFTTFAVPTTTSECKNGAWQNLVRSDFSTFSNQGLCVKYVNTGQ